VDTEAGQAAEMRAHVGLIAHLAPALVALNQDGRRGTAMRARDGFVAHFAAALAALDQGHARYQPPQLDYHAARTPPSA
jgi:hypothetical protein